MNLTNTSVVSNNTDATLLASITVPFLILVLVSLYISHHLLSKSQYALFWDSSKKRQRMGIKCTRNNGKLCHFILKNSCKLRVNHLIYHLYPSLCCINFPLYKDDLHICKKIWLILLILLAITLPLILITGCGVLTIQLIHPMQIGIAVLFLGLSLPFLLYTVASYKYNGYYLTKSATITLIISGLCISIYSFVSALTIEPLTFTGVSAVAMAFQMFLSVPAMYMIADGRGVSLSFQEFTSAIQNFDTELLENLIQNNKKQNATNPIDELLKIGKGNSNNNIQHKTEIIQDMETKSQQVKHDQVIETDHSWKDLPITELLTTAQLIQATPLLHNKDTNKKSAIQLYSLGVLILIGYSIAIVLKTETIEQGVLGFVTTLAVIVYDLAMLLVSGNTTVKQTAKNIFVMTLFRMVLVIGGTKYWFLGHSLCYLCVGTLFSK